MAEASELSVASAARRLGICEKRLRALCDAGHVRCRVDVGIRKRRWISRSEVSRLKIEGIPAGPSRSPATGPLSAR